MKKVLFTIAVVMLAVISAKAEYLYWQVTDAQYKASGINDGAASGYSQLWGTSTGGGNVQLGQMVAGEAIGEAYVQTPTDYSSFYVETYTYDSSTPTKVGEVDPLTSYTGFSVANALSGSNAAAIRTMMSNTWGNAAVTPEPTSGLMMLVGMALLGLKRRRV